jgi:hypothetical protein
MGNYSKATVMKFNGSNWVNVGNAGFSAGFVGIVSLAFSQSDSLPYVAYMDFGNSNKATVMNFNGNNWVNVGNAGFSSGMADYTSLAFNPSDSLPYVAYQDSVNSNKATVMKFDGNNWVYLGNAGFSAGQAYYTSLAFSPSGQPYVAYCDDANNQKATVMKFDGTNWVYVGNAGFSEAYVVSLSFAFSPSGQPSVAYSCLNNYLTKATVMKYDSIYVGVKGLQKSKFSLYPNPATNKITIEISVNSASTQLSIMNLSGEQLITRQLTEPKTQVDIGSLPTGVYFMKLTGDKTVEVRKLIKQ